MMNRLILLALAFAAVAARGEAACDVAPVWPEITMTAKPWAYNWWMASAVDEKGLEAQCAAMKEAGLGGFHVIPIYGAKGYEVKYREMLSPEWIEAWNCAVRTARRHGLGVDLTMGSGWCFGGPWVTKEDAASSGMRVKRAGPGGAGFMIDPFSPQAMSNHVAQFEAAFGAHGTAERPRAFYHDSYEYYGAQPKQGGDWDEQLLKTFGVWTDWCRANGYLTRNEAHGSPVNWLDFYALADIPETEMFGETCRDILISKFASSAAHVMGRKLVASESCTWIGQHFGVPLAEYKRFIDRLFLAGVNHMFYHGCCYSPVEAAWPGWCFYASSEMNPRNPIWRDAKFLNGYVARCQAMFQSSTPDNDTLLYWPLEDYRADVGSLVPMTVHRTEWFHDQPVGAVARKLASEGVAFDYVSDRQLQTLDLSRYAHLVVPPCRKMPPATRAALGRFVERPVRREPFAAVGLAFTRQRRGRETIYFLVNTNRTKIATAVLPSAKGRMWWMNPMTGEVKAHAGEIVLEPDEGGFLVVDGGQDASPRHAIRAAREVRTRKTLSGPWTLTPVCGGPTRPPVRTLKTLSTWSRREDGGEEPFSGTMKYATAVELAEPPIEDVVLDLGRVEQSARVRLNGVDVGFAILAPYRVSIPAAAFRAGRNELEVEVTSVGLNRLRQLGKDGVEWAYFNDVNMVDYRYERVPWAIGTGFQTKTLPFQEYGLFGPVRLEFHDDGAAFITPAETNAACTVAVFEKTVVAKRRIAKAALSVTGLGVFRIFANGREIGADDFLKPGCTVLSKCRHVHSYDVTDALDRAANARNVLTAVVTPTWWSDSSSDKAKRPVALRALLRLVYDDGSSEAVATGPDWLSAYAGSVRRADLFHGEVVDAREVASGLKPSVVTKAFAGELRTAAAKVALRTDLTMKPTSAVVLRGVEGATDAAFGRAKVVRRPATDGPIELDEGEMLVLDFGQNAAAVPSFVVTGEAGGTLHLRHAEMLNEANGERSRGNDGPAGTPYLASLRAARAEILYTLKAGEQAYRPGYTYFGYRYISVTTTAHVVFRDFKSIPVSSVTKAMERGTLVTGDARVNRLISNIRWGMLSNYLSIPTDCPQRDERRGWTADTQVFMNGAAYLADTCDFLRKYLQDLRDEQNGEGMFPCYAPTPYPKDTVWGSCGWTDAGVLIPYRLWTWYGRREIIEESWESMERYMNFLATHETPYRINHADWLAYEHKDPRPGADTRMQDPKYVPVLKDFFHLWMARLMSAMAWEIGRMDRAEHYAQLERDLRRAFARTYIGADGAIKDFWKGQCTDLYMLMLKLCGNPCATAATKKDLIDNIRAHGNRLQTGFLGTAVLLPVLTFQAGAPDVAYDLLFQDQDPSWLYSVDQGATTIWERWNSYTKEKGFGPASMNSFNHYAYGCVIEWLYSAAAGIRQVEIGWKKFILHPYADRRLGHLEAVYESPAGRIASAWKYGADGKLSWTFSIPAGTTAYVTPPWGGEGADYPAGDYELHE